MVLPVEAMEQHSVPGQVAESLEHSRPFRIKGATIHRKSGAFCEAPLQGADDLRKGFASVHPGKAVLSRLPEADPAQKLFGGVLFLLPLVIAFGVICGRIRKNSSAI